MSAGEATVPEAPERHAVDLADPAARDRFLDEALTGARKAFVLTEGLLMYLSAQDVTGLSAAFTRPEIAWWTFDFASRGLQKTPDHCYPKGGMVHIGIPGNKNHIGLLPAPEFHLPACGRQPAHYVGSLIHGIEMSK